MSDANDIDKAEYDNLRAEILFHQTNASAIFGVNIIGLGVGVTASTLIDGILLILAVLSCVLWSRYSDHVMSLFRIASYLQLNLRPRIVARVGEPVLNWESFLRTDTISVGPLPLKRLSADSRIGIVYASVAFSLPPPLLCIAFTAKRWSVTSGAGWVLLFVVVFLVLLVWAYAIARTVSVTKWILAIDSRITNSSIETTSAG